MDSLPRTLHRPDSPTESESSQGSAPTVAGSAGGGTAASTAASTVSEPASATSGGSSVGGIREALQRKKEALMYKKRQLDGGPLRVTRSDEATDEPVKLHEKLQKIRSRLDVLSPIIIQLDEDFSSTVDIIKDGKTTASETEIRLMTEIGEMRHIIESQEAERQRLEEQIQQLDNRCADMLRSGQEQDLTQIDSMRQQRSTLEEQLVNLLCDLEINKLETCNKMHEAAALIKRAQRHGVPLDSGPGYVSDQGTSSGYCSEAAGRVPFACESHGVAHVGWDSSDGGSPRQDDENRDVILPWNMRPAVNYYELAPGAAGTGTTDPAAADGGGTGGAQPSADEADYDGPSPNSIGSMNRIFNEGTQYPRPGAGGTTGGVTGTCESGLIGAEDMLSTTAFNQCYESQDAAMVATEPSSDAEAKPVDQSGQPNETTKNETAKDRVKMEDRFY